MENQNVKFRQTVKELRQMAKERKIKYYYKMRREELLSALNPNTSATKRNELQHKCKRKY